MSFCVYYVAPVIIQYYLAPVFSFAVVFSPFLSQLLLSWVCVLLFFLVR